MVAVTIDDLKIAFADAQLASIKLTQQLQAALQKLKAMEKKLAAVETATADTPSNK